MKTQNLIQMNANVIKVTNLKKGDVFKRIESTGYSSDGVLYGVVLDMYNTGENSFIEVLEYKKSYNDMSADIRIYKGLDDISIFPTTIDDVKEHFESNIARLEKDIEEEKEKLQKKIEGLEKARKFVSGEQSKKLTEMSFEEISQAEYDADKLIKEAKLKELSL